MNKRAWLVFLSVQTIGIAAGASTELPLSDRLGPLLWYTWFLGLFPGNYLAALLIEHSLWNSGVSLRQMSLLEIPVLILINAAVWWLLAFAVRVAKQAWRHSRANFRTSSLP